MSSTGRVDVLRRAMAALPAAVIIFGLAGAARASDDVARSIEQMAQHLAIDIDRHRTNTAGPFPEGPRVRVAILPFDPLKIPVPGYVAEEFSSLLKSHLIRAGGGGITLLAREELSVLMRDARDMGGGAASGGRYSALVEHAADVDVLVYGTIRPRQEVEAVALSYEALDRKGTIVSAAGPKIIPIADYAPVRLLSLDQAVTTAAGHFRNRAHDMERLFQGAVVYQDTGARPALDRLLTGRLVARLTDAFSDPLTGRHLILHDFNDAPASRGLETDARPLLPPNAPPEPLSATDYVLSGSYWEFEDSLELQLQLRNPAGVTHLWTGRMRKRGLAPATYRPVNAHTGRFNFGHMRERDGLGPIDFRLTTDRGETPVYRIGELLRLTIELDRDAWVYCFYHGADGSTIQVLPNPFFRQNLGSPHFAGGVAHRVPDPEARQFNFDLRFRPPTGEELMKCFATSEDVTGRLPPTLRGTALEALPVDLASRLSHVFRTLPDVGVTEASVAVTVEKAE